MGAARGGAVLLGEAGLTVTGMTAGILSMLVFGAGNDYALLLVARYREELGRHEDRREAMRAPLRRAGPAIAASGLTVSLSLLALLAARVGASASLGPIAAVGVLIAMVTALILLPALLLLFDRGIFWPLIPRPRRASDPASHGPWRRAGACLVQRQHPAWGLIALALLALAVGISQLSTTHAAADQFDSDVEAVAGQRLLERSFPAGDTAPLTIVLPDSDRAQAARLATELRRRGLVSRLDRIETARTGALLALSLPDDPFGRHALETIPRLRTAVRTLAGPQALVGGETAEDYDLRVAARRDNWLVVPLALAAVSLILALLLRALVAPLLLVATVVLSFLATLGAGALGFQAFGFQGADASLPLLSFVFLVALGVDYNIFLMSRVREETLAHGTREGMLRGLAATGSAISSAGLVLAGTFALLAALPYVPLVEFGFLIAAGVLLDTFLVRSLLVPALTFVLDRRIWWPSALARTRAPLSAPERPSTTPSRKPRRASTAARGW